MLHPYCHLRLLGTRVRLSITHILSAGISLITMHGTLLTRIVVIKNCIFTNSCINITINAKIITSNPKNLYNHIDRTL